MSNRTIRRAVKGVPLTSADHDANMARLEGFETLAELLADEAVATHSFFAENEVIRTRDEGFRYRVAASGASDHHLTTAGGLKLYVLPSDEGVYNFKAFGGVADDATDNYDALMLAIYKPAEAPTIYFPQGSYYVSQTIHLKRHVVFKGNHTGLSGASSFPTLRFPTNTIGIWVNRHDTYGGHVIFTFANLAAVEAEVATYSGRHVGTWYKVTSGSRLFEIVASDEETYDVETAGGLRLIELDFSLLGPMPDGAADGSMFQGIALSGTTVGTDKTAHGLKSQARIFVDRCAMTGFSGDGIHIFAASDRKGSGTSTPLKTGGPGDTYGNANLCQVRNTLCNGNGGNGFFIQGYDANAGYFECLDAVGNGRWGVVDNSFLGNTHVGHHIAFCGVGRSSGNTSGVQSALVTYGGNRYSAHPTATEQQLVDTTPGSNNNIWRLRGAGGGHGTDVPTWTAAQPLGTFFVGGSMLIEGDNNRSVMTYVYTEGGQGPTWVRAQHVMPGPGMMGAGVEEGSQWRTENRAIRATEFSATGYVDFLEEDEEPATGNVTTTIGGNDGNADLMSWSGTHNGLATGIHRMKVRNGDTVFGHSNSDADEIARITGANTAYQFGTGAAVPKIWTFRGFGIGYGSTARRMLNGTAAPSSGAWGRGEIVWNIEPSAGGFAGWICTEAGTPGVWKEFGLIEE